ncbi:NAD(P)(+) transhydrogenase (Re/Si-specific) subunit beta [Halococcoides cellulosivorans]|uniref:NAD(P)(+) transhydrogenase (Re/Si-specific) subunit beta n=1 Tax=Halococcoides cellulosivorans TaxID=1679096 RepID=UPI001F278948|nr:NAD(P)(+) transhydrogenase (Re/Si-specific) subunit beta [Halococcoides cellulosivorans]
MGNALQADTLASRLPEEIGLAPKHGPYRIRCQRGFDIQRIAVTGMPVLEVWDAGSVIVNKRSLSHGFAGIPNPLFAKDNTSMLFGDAKDSMQELLAQYQEATE